jgi:hypothetical protein
MAWSFDDELIHKTLVVGKNKQKCVGAGNGATPGSIAISGVANFGAEGFGQAESTLMVETSEHQSGDRALTVKGNATIEGDAENVLIVDGDLYVSGKIDGDNKGRLASRFGTADALGKVFDIPHPTYGKGHRLVHACIEGPEVGVYYRGRCRNKKEILLPHYWKDLVHVDSITVQLQPVGAHQDIIVKRWDLEKVYLQSQGGLPIDCFYHVYGERKDINPLHVEYEGETWEDYPDPNHRNFDPLDPNRNLLDETYRGPRNTVTM